MGIENWLICLCKLRRHAFHLPSQLSGSREGAGGEGAVGEATIGEGVAGGKLLSCQLKESL